MIVNGRTVRPSTLAERRLLLSGGVTHVRVPRSQNPYAVARRLGRLAKGEVAELRKLLATIHQAPRPNPMPIPTPDLDEPDPWPIHA